MKVSVELIGAVDNRLSVPKATTLAWLLGMHFAKSFPESRDQIEDALTHLKQLEHTSIPLNDSPYFKGTMPKDMGRLVGMILMKNKSITVVLADEEIYLLMNNDDTNKHYIVDLRDSSIAFFSSFDCSAPEYFNDRVKKKASFVAYSVEFPAPKVPEPEEPAPLVPVPTQDTDAACTASAPAPAIKKKRIVKKAKIEEPTE